MQIRSTSSSLYLSSLFPTLLINLYHLTIEPHLFSLLLTKFIFDLLSIIFKIPNIPSPFRDYIIPGTLASSTYGRKTPGCVKPVQVKGAEVLISLTPNVDSGLRVEWI